MANSSSVSFVRTPWHYVAKTIEAAETQRAQAQQPLAVGRAELAVQAWKMAERLKRCAEVVKFPAGVVVGQWERDTSGHLAECRGVLKGVRCRGLLHVFTQAVDTAASKTYRGAVAGLYRMGVTRGVKPQPVDFRFAASVGQFIGTLTCRVIDAIFIGIGLGLGGLCGIVTGAVAMGHSAAAIRRAYAGLETGLTKAERQMLRGHLPESRDERDALVLRAAGCIDTSHSFADRVKLIDYIDHLPALFQQSFIDLQATGMGRELTYRCVCEQPETSPIIRSLLELREKARQTILDFIVRVGAIRDAHSISAVVQGLLPLTDSHCFADLDPLFRVSAVSHLRNAELIRELLPSTRQNGFANLLDKLLRIGKFDIAQIEAIVHAWSSLPLRHRGVVATTSLLLLMPWMDVVTLRGVIHQLATTEARDRACVAAMTSTLLRKVDGLSNADRIIVVSILADTVKGMTRPRRALLEESFLKLQQGKLSSTAIAHHCAALATEKEESDDILQGVLESIVQRGMCGIELATTTTAFTQIPTLLRGDVLTAASYFVDAFTPVATCCQIFADLATVLGSHPYTGSELIASVCNARPELPARIAYLRALATIPIAEGVDFCASFAVLNAKIVTQVGGHGYPAVGFSHKHLGPFTKTSEVGLEDAIKALDILSRLPHEERATFAQLSLNAVKSLMGLPSGTKSNVWQHYDGRGVDSTDRTRLLEALASMSPNRRMRLVLLMESVPLLTNPYAHNSTIIQRIETVAHMTQLGQPWIASEIAEDQESFALIMHSMEGQYEQTEGNEPHTLAAERAYMQLHGLYPIDPPQMDVNPTVT